MRKTEQVGQKALPPVWDQIKALLSKYYLEGWHTVWIHPSGRVFHPAGVWMDEKQEKRFFKKGCVRIELDSYGDGRLSIVTVSGSPEHVSKWEGGIRAAVRKQQAESARVVTD